VIGKPNVGKSSLINAILGKDRQIVTEIPGTTRDSIDTRIQYYGRELSLIDTAGLRRKPKVIENVEFFSTVRTRKSIERCDVALVLFDCDEGLATQDIRIIGEALELKKGVVLVGNKWDLIEKNVQTAADFETALQERLADLDFVPIIFISAKLKQRVFKVIEMALQVNEERNKKLTTSQLNKALQPVFERQPPSAVQGKHVSIQYMNQVKSKPPVFAFYGNEPGLITPQYRKFMERQIREHFGFRGVPLSLTFKEK
jgi:GTP-binding protein